MITAATATGGTAVPAIDWKDRFEKAISAGIEGKAKVSEKLRERDQQLNAANLRIQELEREIAKLQPAGSRVRELERRYEKDMTDSARKIMEHRRRVQRGQRGVLEDVIALLQERIRMLPEADPNEDWKVEDQ